MIVNMELSAHIQHIIRIPTSINPAIELWCKLTALDNAIEW